MFAEEVGVRRESGVCVSDVTSDVVNRPGRQVRGRPRWSKFCGGARYKHITNIQQQQTLQSLQAVYKTSLTNFQISRTHLTKYQQDFYTDRAETSKYYNVGYKYMHFQ